MTNVLDLLDQTAFVGEQATGAVNMLQCVWVYDRAVDIDGLRRFHHHLQRGRLSRRIEQSPLPFGRHRWVAPNGSPTLEIVETPRPREQFDEWLREQSNTPLDLERGPGWHLGVLPFTDGGWGVSLAVSHCLADGVGLSLALADAASGIDDPVSWPPDASSRSNSTTDPLSTVSIAGMAGSQARWNRSRVMWSAGLVCIRYLEGRWRAPRPGRMLR